MPKFGSKNTLFRYFSPRMPYLDIFREELKKNIVIFEIITLKLVYLQNFAKMPDLGIPELEFENNFVIFEISSLEFV